MSEGDGVGAAVRRSKAHIRQGALLGPPRRPDAPARPAGSTDAGHGLRRVQDRARPGGRENRTAEAPRHRRTPATPGAPGPIPPIPPRFAGLSKVGGSPDAELHSSSTRAATPGRWVSVVAFNSELRDFSPKGSPLESGARGAFRSWRCRSRQWSESVRRQAVPSLGGAFHTRGPTVSRRGRAGHGLARRGCPAH